MYSLASGGGRRPGTWTVGSGRSAGIATKLATDSIVHFALLPPSRMTFAIVGFTLACNAEGTGIGGGSRWHWDGLARTAYRRTGSGKSKKAAWKSNRRLLGGLRPIAKDWKPAHSGHVRQIELRLLQLIRVSPASVPVSRWK